MNEKNIIQLSQKLQLKNKQTFILKVFIRVIRAIRG